MWFKHVFLDLDGTLSDSAPGLRNGVRYMMRQVGITENDEKNIYAFFGPPILHSLKTKYGLKDAAAQEAYAHFRRYYLSRGVYENVLYPGVKKMIHALKKKGAKVYIATAKRSKAATMSVRHLKIEDLFDGIYSADPDHNVYFKEEILQSAIDRLGFVPDDAVMVGDRTSDIQAGKAFRFSTVGVLYGYGEREEIESAAPDHTVKTVKELEKLLLRQ